MKGSPREPLPHQRGRTVHAVLPNDIDDPRTPSGGNLYDRRVCDGLTALGWSVREHAVPGRWPRPDGAARAQLDATLGGVPDDAVVLLDGLIASAVPEVLGAHAGRLRIAVVVHLPLADDSERDALSVVDAIVTTSRWTRRRLLELYPLSVGRLHVAAPGVDQAPVTPGSAQGSRLLCVATVAPHKGHDVLVEALAGLGHRSWRCVCVGSLTAAPDFVDGLRRASLGHGIADRVAFAGPRVAAELAARYAAADLVVLASRGETYGMVATEALARGIPVLVTDVGGLPEAVGRAGDGTVPGLVVRPDDPAALAGALRQWLDEPGLRARLRHRALSRRAALTGWATTSALVAGALLTVATSVRAGR